MKVRDVMTRDVVSLQADATLRDAINIFQKYRFRHLPIVDEGQLVGIVTDRDIKRATPSLHSGVSQEDYERVLADTTLVQVMTRDPHTIGPDDELKHVVQVMIDRKYGAMPVVDHGRLVGIVSDIDLLRVLHDKL